MVQGQAAEGRPIVIIRGIKPETTNGSGRDLMRDIADDLFR
jgi:F420-0:gamma-glutamyl ligase